jgi:hypothetical protein
MMDMDDDPLEFEVNHERNRQYFKVFGFLAFVLPGCGFGMFFTKILGPALFGPRSWAPLFLSPLLAGGIAYAAARILGRRMGGFGHSRNRYWVDAGHNLRVETGGGLEINLAIPLDRIDQVELLHGPLMSWGGVRALKVYIPGGPVTLLGLRSPEKVRDILLDERRKALREIQAERYA